MASADGTADDAAAPPAPDSAASAQPSAFIRFAGQENGATTVGNGHMDIGAVSDPPKLLRRNLPGTKAADMWRWSRRPLTQDQEQLNESRHSQGPLRIPEDIQDLIREDPADFDRIYGPRGETEADSLVWQYEHLRQFVIEFNQLLVVLGDDCTPETCPKMTASNEWQYLCAAHRKPQDCAALDYMTHTIDSSTGLLTSAKHFASRSHVPPMSGKYFQSMARRLYRIFAHVYYHHRHVFDEVEAGTHLCARFSHFVMKYQLMSPSMLLVPQDAYEPKA